MWLRLTNTTDGATPTRRLARTVDGERYETAVPESGIVQVPAAFGEALIAEGAAVEHDSDE